MSLVYFKHLIKDLFSAKEVVTLGMGDSMFEKYLNFKLYVFYDMVINLFIVNLVTASFLSKKKNPPDANQSILPVLKEGIRLKSTSI